jgi:hypothetical protein
MTTKAEEMKERKALSGSTSATTYRQMAEVNEELGGRWSKADLLVGKTPAIQYPKGADWTRNDVGVEPPLNYSIEELMPVGEPHEIAQAAELAGEVGTSSPPTASALVALPAAPTSDQSPDVVRPGSAANPVASQLAELLPKLVRRKVK